MRAAQYNATAAAAADSAGAINRSTTAAETQGTAAADSNAVDGDSQGSRSPEGAVPSALLANPYGLEALDAGIMPDWEMNIVWGDDRHFKRGRDQQRASAAAADLNNNMVGTTHQVQQQQEPAQQQHNAGQLPGSGSALPGAASVMPGAASGVPGSKSGLSCGLSTPAASLGPDGVLPAAPPGVLPDGGSADGQPSGALVRQSSMAAGSALGGVAAGTVAVKSGGRRTSKQGYGGKAEAIPLGKAKKDHYAVLAHLQADPHMLRLLTPADASALAATAATDAGDAAALVAAATGDRAAVAALGRAWGGAGAGYRGAGRQGEQQQFVDAAAAEQLKLRHIPDLLSKEFRPLLPDDEDWLADIIWDKDEAAEQAAGQQPGAGKLDMSASKEQQQKQEKQQPGAVGKSQQQQGQLVSASQSEGGLTGLLTGRVKVLWDLNDPHMVFEAVNTAHFSTASAVVQQAPQKVRCCSQADEHT